MTQTTTILAVIIGLIIIVCGFTELAQGIYDGLHKSSIVYFAGEGDNQ